MAPSLPERSTDLAILSMMGKVRRAIIIRGDSRSEQVIRLRWALLLACLFVTDCISKEEAIEGMVLGRSSSLAHTAESMNSPALRLLLSLLMYVTLHLSFPPPSH